jgi:hypothetical protein
MLADKRYCYPLTISDFASRYLICCEALATTKAMLRRKQNTTKFARRCSVDSVSLCSMPRKA